MKPRYKELIAFVVFFLICVVATPSYAFDPLQFGAGFASGWAVHEAGHEIAINNTDHASDVVWDGAHTTFELIRVIRPSHGRRIATSGITADVISEEILLRGAVNDFTLGWHFWNIVGGSVTAIRGMSDSDYGGRDYSLYGKYGGNKDRIAMARIGYSVLAGYRLWKNPKWKSYISRDGLLVLEWGW